MATYVDVDMIPEAVPAVKAAGLSVEILEEHGPAGGNALVRVWGPLPLLIMFLEREEYGDDIEIHCVTR